MSVKLSLIDAWHSTKNGFKRLFGFWKSNWLFAVGLVLFESFFLYGTSMAVVPFDDQDVVEVTELLTKKAENSDFGLALSSVSMKWRGNSDFYIYSNNDLQNFQMRNQNFDEEKSYIFAGYVPYESFVPFRFHNEIDQNNYDCPMILFESKYTGRDFYFDLPLLAGSFPRYMAQNTVVILDDLADDLLSSGTEDYSTLIGKSLLGNCVSTTGSIPQTYNIGAIVDSSGSLGQFLKAVFGTNIIFSPEYSAIQMNGSVFFCASKNRVENSKMIDFVFEKYRTSTGTSRALEIGYKAEYSFFDFDQGTYSFVKGTDDANINTIIDFYFGSRPVLLCIVGCVMILASVVVAWLLIWKNYLVLLSGTIGSRLATIWTCSSLALLLVSLAYRFFPIVPKLLTVSFLTVSTTASTVIFLSWIVIIGVLTFVMLRKDKDLTQAS
jgi:hypothetical protein